jgi:hypothetical protein
MYNSTLSLTSALDVGEWSTSRPGHFTLGIHFIGGWVGPRDGLDKCGKSRPPPGLDPPTVDPVAGRCTYWAIPAPLLWTAPFEDKLNA